MCGIVDVNVRIRLLNWFANQCDDKQFEQVSFHRYNRPDSIPEFDVSRFATDPAS